MLKFGDRNELGQFVKGHTPWNKGKKIEVKPFGFCPYYGKNNPICLFCYAYVNGEEWVKKAMCYVGRHLIEV